MVIYIKLTKRLRVLLCLVLFTTMIFGMTLGVYAEQNNYYLRTYYESDFKTLFVTSGSIDVQGDTILNKGDVIKVCTTDNCTNIIYVNGTVSYKCEKEIGLDVPFTIPPTTDTYQFSYSSDATTRTATLYLTSIGLPQPSLQQSSSHEHSYSWQTVKEATE